MNTLESMFDMLGFYGPFLLILLTVIVLKNRTMYYNYYFIGYLVNMLTNEVLKLVLKQPRPNTDEALFRMMKHNRQQGLDPQQYGMPSGHAQSVAYSTSFLFFLTRKARDLQQWPWIFAIVSLWTIVQRVWKKEHSVAQVLVGAILGSAMGFLFFSFSEKKLMGSLEMKKDDGNLQSENMIH